MLDDLEKFPTGMEAQLVRKYIWQVLKGIEFCHAHHVSHCTTYHHVHSNLARCFIVCPSTRRLVIIVGCYSYRLQYLQGNSYIIKVM